MKKLIAFTIFAAAISAQAETVVSRVKGGITIYNEACVLSKDNIDPDLIGSVARSNNRVGCFFRGNAANAIAWEGGKVQRFDKSDEKMDEAFVRETTKRGHCERYDVQVQGRTVHTAEYDQCMRGEPVAEVGRLR